MRDVKARIPTVWIMCPKCGNEYPSSGNAPLCEVCGYDDFAGVRNDPFRSGAVTRGLRRVN